MIVAKREFCRDVVTRDVNRRVVVRLSSLARCTTWKKKMPELGPSVLVVVVPMICRERPPLPKISEHAPEPGTRNGSTPRCYPALFLVLFDTPIDILQYVGRTVVEPEGRIEGKSVTVCKHCTLANIRTEARGSSPGEHLGR